MKELANQNAVLRKGDVLHFKNDGRNATIVVKKYLADDSYGVSFSAQELLETFTETGQDLDNVEVIIEPNTYYYGDAVVSLWIEVRRDATEEEKEEAKGLILQRLKSERKNRDQELQEMIRRVEAAGYSVLSD